MSLQAFIGIKCEQDLKEQLERLAEQENRKLSDYVRLILKQHIHESSVDKNPDSQKTFCKTQATKLQLGEAE